GAQSVVDLRLPDLPPSILGHAAPLDARAAATLHPAAPSTGAPAALAAAPAVAPRVAALLLRMQPALLDDQHQTRVDRALAPQPPPPTEPRRPPSRRPQQLLQRVQSDDEPGLRRHHHHHQRLRLGPLRWRRWPRRPTGAICAICKLDHCGRCAYLVL